MKSPPTEVPRSQKGSVQATFQSMERELRAGSVTVLPAAFSLASSYSPNLYGRSGEALQHAENYIKDVKNARSSTLQRMQAVDQ